MLIPFLAKRVAVMAAMAIAIALVVAGPQLGLPAGIVLGAFLGLYKARLSGRVLASAVNGASPAKSTLTGLLAQLLTLCFLTAAALAGVWLFAGGAIGLLLLPLFICINAMTERAGLTHNNWGEAGAGGEGG